MYYPATGVCIRIRTNTIVGRTVRIIASRIIRARAICRDRTRLNIGLPLYLHCGAPIVLMLSPHATSGIL